MTTVEIRLHALGGLRIKRWRETYESVQDAEQRKARAFRAYDKRVHSIWIYPTHKAA